jgi:transcriptional regulator with XRE-family HTH domain
MDSVEPDSPQPAQAAFGQVPRRYRLAAGLSQEELAERAGLSVPGLSALEKEAPARSPGRLGLPAIMEFPMATGAMPLQGRRPHSR